MMNWQPFSKKEGKYLHLWASYLWELLRIWRNLCSVSQWSEPGSSLREGESCAWGACDQCCVCKRRPHRSAARPLHLPTPLDMALLDLTSHVPLCPIYSAISSSDMFLWQVCDLCKAVCVSQLGFGKTCPLLDQSLHLLQFKHDWQFRKCTYSYC